MQIQARQPQQETLMQPAWRVWPDGTVQSTDEALFFWMGDDYQLISARSEEEALEIANLAVPDMH